MEVAESRPRVSRAVSGLLLYTVLNLLASLCFKECGTDAAHTWRYFAAGNVLGATSLIFIMWVYAGMNVNLAGALLMGLGSISVQGAFWLIYDVRLTPLQWTGVALAIAGAVVAVAGKPRPRAAIAPDTGGGGEVGT